MATVENIGNIPNEHGKAKRVVRASARALRAVAGLFMIEQVEPAKNPDVWPNNVRPRHDERVLTGMDAYAAADAAKKAVLARTTDAPEVTETAPTADQTALSEIPTNLAYEETPTEEYVGKRRAETSEHQLVGASTGGAHK